MGTEDGNSFKEKRKMAQEAGPEHKMMARHLEPRKMGGGAGGRASSQFLSLIICLPQLI